MPYCWDNPLLSDNNNLIIKCIDQSLKHNKIEETVDLIPLKVHVNLRDILEPHQQFKNIREYVFLEEHNYAVREKNSQLEFKPNIALVTETKYGLKCKLCNKIYVSVVSLQQHFKSHTKVKLFQCKVCDKYFTQQSNLWKHIQLHTGEQPFQCPQCKKRFSQRANMEKHMLIHSGDKPYDCPYCLRCFTQLANLNKHILLHLGTQPYKCKYCEKQFVQKSNKKKHESIHEGIKPYVCSLCNFSCNQQGNLKRHLTLHTNSKISTCDNCGKAFINQQEQTLGNIKNCFCSVCVINTEIIEPWDILTECNSQEKNVHVKWETNMEEQ